MPPQGSWVPLNLSAARRGKRHDKLQRVMQVASRIVSQFLTTTRAAIFYFVLAGLKARWFVATFIFSPTPCMHALRPKGRSNT